MGIISKIKDKLTRNRTKKKEMLKDLLTVEFEMGHQSGRWATDEYIFTDVAQNEIDFMTGKWIEKRFPSFKYEYEPSDFEPYAEEDYNGCVLTKEELQDIINANTFVDDENYLIVDAIASDILESLKAFVFKEIL